MTGWGYVAGYGLTVVVVVWWVVAILRVVREPTEQEQAAAQQARIDHEFFALTARLADQLTIEED